jgi:TnpA family transposase
VHALRRDLRYSHHGAFRSAHLQGQTEAAWCLTVLTNAVVTWTSEYYGLALAAMRAEGISVDDEGLILLNPRQGRGPPSPSRVYSRVTTGIGRRR